MKSSSDMSPRARAARYILLGNIVVFAVGLVVNLSGIYLKKQQAPDYEPTWIYVILLVVSLIFAIMAYRWLKRDLRLGMWSYAVVGALLLGTMLVYDAVVSGSNEVPILIAMFHVGVFAIGLVLGLRDALIYATLVSILSFILGILYGDSGSIYASVAVAYAMTLPSWLVERMEKDLRESEEKFGAMFRESLDVILVVDPETKEILQANQAARTVLGYPPVQLLGQNFASICVSSSGEGVSDFLQRLEVNAALFESHEFLRADGSLCPMDLTATQIPWGEEQMTLVTLRDVTEREMAERELRRYREHLEELVELRTAALEARNEELDAFAHTVAHDLKSPLTRLIGASTVLQNAYDRLSAEQRRYYLEAIEEGSYRMSNIIEELLLLASVRRLDDVTLMPLDMSTIVNNTEQRLSHLIEKHHAEITKPEQWPQAVGYAPWVREIWANYLSNAIKYGGVPPRIELGYQVEDSADHIHFWVRDNGMGLTEEQMDKLFVPFTRIDQMRAEGDGLGLSIVRRIVEKLGGNVGVESAEGEGSLFSFSLPAARRVERD